MHRTAIKKIDKQWLS